MPNLPTINKAKVCYYCGTPLTENNRTIDHMIPLSRGGLNRQENRVWCCRKCNASKMDMTVEEFNIYKELKKQYTGQELIDKCREQDILLWTHERQERNKRERNKRLKERMNEDGNKKLSCI